MAVLLGCISFNCSDVMENNHQDIYIGSGNSLRKNPPDISYLYLILFYLFYHVSVVPIMTHLKMLVSFDNMHK